MEYSQITQKSRLYEYGKGKEFDTREEALKEAQKEEQSAKTKTALKRLWEYVKTEIVEEDNSFQVIATFEIPSIFE